jgi:hypothetical protein
MNFKDFEKYFENEAEKELVFNQEYENGGVELSTNINEDFALECFGDFCVKNNIEQGDDVYNGLEVEFDKNVEKIVNEFNERVIDEAYEYEPDDPNWQY